MNGPPLTDVRLWRALPAARRTVRSASDRRACASEEVAFELPIVPRAFAAAILTSGIAHQKIEACAKCAMAS